MSEKRCIVVGGGDFAPVLLPQTEPGDLIIAADSGLKGLEEAGIKADVCVGDFDSLGCEPNCREVVRLPVEKDDTDLIAALKIGLERGYRDFLLFGVLGGARFSHSLAAVQTLLWLMKKGARGTVISSGCRVYPLGRGKRDYPETKRGTISVFAAGGEAEVTLRGLKYPLCRYRLKPSFPLGVSNSFTGCPASIQVHFGRVIIVEE